MARRLNSTRLDVNAAALVAASLGGVMMLLAPMPGVVTATSEPLPFIVEGADSATSTPSQRDEFEAARGFGSPSPADGSPIPTSGTENRLHADAEDAGPTTATTSSANSFTISPPETRRPPSTQPTSSTPSSNTSGPTTTLTSVTASSAPTPPTTSIAPQVSAVTTPTTSAAPSTTEKPTTTAAPSTTPNPTTSVTSPGTVTRILATADIGDCNDSAAERVGNLAATLEGQLIAVGDIAYPDGSLAEIERCFAQPFRAVLDRVIPVVGNHEYGTSGASGWKQFFGRTDTYYSTRLGSWKLIVVDTECNLIGGCGPDDPQQQWLRSQLSTAPQCTAVAMHRPYRVSSAKYDREDRSAIIHQMVVDARVDVILTGHEHIYERLQFGTTHQFVVGTGGAGLRSAGPPIAESRKIVEGRHGVVTMDLSDDAFSWRFLDTEGAVHDSGSASCS